MIRVRVGDFRIGEEERRAINEVLDYGRFQREDIVIMKAKVRGEWKNESGYYWFDWTTRE